MPLLNIFVLSIVNIVFKIAKYVSFNPIILIYLVLYVY